MCGLIQTKWDTSTFISPMVVHIRDLSTAEASFASPSIAVLKQVRENETVSYRMGHHGLAK